MGAIFISLWLTSYGFEAGLRNIYIYVISLIRMWGRCEEYLFYLPHTGLRCVWGIFISLLFALYRCEAGGRNIYIFFICLIRVWSGSEEYVYHLYLPYPGVRQVGAIFISLWFTSYGFEAGLRNIYIYVICLIRMWGRCEEYLYLFYLPHTGLRCVWGIFISLLFALYMCEAGGRNIYIFFICLIRVWSGSEEYVYHLYLPYTGVRQVGGIFISLWFSSYGFMAGLRNI